MKSFVYGEQSLTKNFYDIFYISSISPTCLLCETKIETLSMKSLNYLEDLFLLYWFSRNREREKERERFIRNEESWSVDYRQKCTNSWLLPKRKVTSFFLHDFAKHRTCKSLAWVFLFVLYETIIWRKPLRNSWTPNNFYWLYHICLYLFLAADSF